MPQMVRSRNGGREESAMLHDERFPGESDEYRQARDELLGEELDLRRQIEAAAAKRRPAPLGGVVPGGCPLPGGGRAVGGGGAGRPAGPLPGRTGGALGFKLRGLSAGGGPAP